jgi:alpha-beta hydrolase superfamily lysophospholipase
MSKETSCSEPGRASTRILCSPVSALMDRYRKAGVSPLSHHFYTGGRHEMLNETNRDEVRTNLLLWISEVLHW